MGVGERDLFFCSEMGGVTETHHTEETKSQSLPFKANTWLMKENPTTKKTHHAEVPLVVRYAEGDVPQGVGARGVLLCLVFVDRVLGGMAYDLWNCVCGVQQSMDTHYKRHTHAPSAQTVYRPGRRRERSMWLS